MDVGSKLLVRVALETSLGVEATLSAALGAGNRSAVAPIVCWKGGLARLRGGAGKAYKGLRT